MKITPQFLESLEMNGANFKEIEQFKRRYEQTSKPVKPIQVPTIPVAVKPTPVPETPVAVKPAPVPETPTTAPSKPTPVPAKPVQRPIVRKPIKRS
jgi:hypothetical protein